MDTAVERAQKLLPTDREQVQRELYRPEEAGLALGLSRTMIFRLLASGELASVRIGTARRIPRSALAKYVARLSADA